MPGIRYETSRTKPETRFRTIRPNRLVRNFQVDVVGRVRRRRGWLRRPIFIRGRIDVVRIQYDERRTSSLRRATGARIDCSRAKTNFSSSTLAVRPSFILLLPFDVDGMGFCARRRAGQNARLLLSNNAQK